MNDIHVSGADAGNKSSITTQRSLPDKVRRYPSTDAVADLTVISLGAGVQSTALVMLAIEGKIHADCAVFADTQWEPVAVYEHAKRLQAICDEAGFPMYVVTAGSLREKALRGQGATALPVYTVKANGDRGMGNRSCTRDFKIRPVQQQTRRLLGGSTRGKHVDMVLGISLDESNRMSDSKVGWASNTYPFVDMGWRRNNCEDYLASLGIEAPRSACIVCPFRSDEQWTKLTDAEVEIAGNDEDRLQRTTKLDAVPWLHKSNRPIRGVVADLRKFAADDLNMLDAECSGYCHV